VQLDVHGPCHIVPMKCSGAECFEILLFVIRPRTSGFKIWVSVDYVPDPGT
jgi:hypothetical protein